MQQMTEEQRRELEEKIKKMSPEELKEFQKQQCVFCQIIAGKIPSKKIYEDKFCVAIMDINPAAIGHVLLLPKEHYAVMPQVTDKEIGHMFTVAKYLSQAMLRKLKVEGTNVFVANGQIAGQNAQHFMIHIIPRKEDDGVLDLPKHLVDEPLREKLKGVLGKRVNELFGIKEKKVTVKEEPKAEEKPKEETEEKKENEEEAEVKENEAVDEVEAEEKEEEKKENEEDEKEEANLDDIADLFK